MSAREGLRVLVCGGRRFGDKDHLFRVLDEQHAKAPIRVIIHGGVSGADYLADAWAVQRGVDVEEFQANWTYYGRSAGPRRNQRMVDDGEPDLVIAFSGARGTADMVRRSKAAGIEVIEVCGGRDG